MGETPNTAQIISLFGSGYVPEAHGAEHVKEPQPFHRQRGVIVLLCLLALSTAAGAIAATNWSRTAPVPDEVWSTPTAVLKLPGGFGVDDAIY
jgi:hypothetical protein